MSPKTTPSAARVRAAVRLRATGWIVAASDISLAVFPSAGPYRWSRSGSRGIAPAGRRVNRIFDVFADAVTQFPLQSRLDFYMKPMAEITFDQVGRSREAGRC